MEFNAMMSDWNSDVLRGLTNKLQKNYRREFLGLKRMRLIRSLSNNSVYACKTSEVLKCMLIDQTQTNFDQA
jgi:hypothetical protein